MKFSHILKSVVAGCLVLGGNTLYAAEVVIEAKFEPPKATPIIYHKEVLRPSESNAVERCINILKKSKVESVSPAVNEIPQGGLTRKSATTLGSSPEISRLDSRNPTIKQPPTESVSPEMFKPVGDRMAMFGKNVEASMNKHGTEFFFSNIPALKLTGKTGELPSNEKAVGLARDYLKMTGLMPRNESELKVGHVGGITQMLSNGEKPEKKASVVYFHRELDGIRVSNFGSSITITLGESEIPAGVQYRWRNVANKERLPPGSFLGAERIRALIKEDVNRVYARDSLVLINKIEYVLYDNGGDFIQPAFRYEGVSKSNLKGIDDMPVLGYVPAVEKLYEPITHPGFSPEMKQPTTRSGQTEQGENE